MLLLKPYLGCNIACKYCYEGRYRRKYHPQKNYNLAAVLGKIEEFKNLEVALHGGEPLTLPKKDVEKIFAKSYQIHKKSSLQTNGTLIDDDYVKIFKKYKTSVGISYDGPGILSEYRPWTEKVGQKIVRLVKEGINVSLIIVISKANAGNDSRLLKLKEYILYVSQKLKITGRLNPCYDAPGFELPLKRMVLVYRQLAEFLLHNNLKWSPFQDIIAGLQGKNRVCVFSGCDPFATQTATVVLGDGSLTNCMRTNKEGILLRDFASYSVRDEILQNVPQKFGGCMGCRYWIGCRGGCPSGALDNDWRNRTYLCPVWKALFAYYENVMKSLDLCLSIDKPKPLSRQEQQKLSGERNQHQDMQHGDYYDFSPNGDKNNSRAYHP